MDRIEGLYEPRFVTEPVVTCIAEMMLNYEGIDGLVEWARSRAPACLPDETLLLGTPRDRARSLFPHDMARGGDWMNPGSLSDNEMLVELAGRKCYNSFGLKAGRKSNREYIEHTQSGDPPHASIMYHAKMSFFIAGVSRRVSHELIRNYVGADRDEEGSPSQESTRYVANAGFFVTPPKYLADGGWRLEAYQDSCRESYSRYRHMVQDELDAHAETHGQAPKGMDYKRILEAASSLLHHSVETSFVWTTNPMALAKLFKERDNPLADMEFQRFAKAWKKLCLERWPNLFPQPWMRSEAVQ